MTRRLGDTIAAALLSYPAPGAGVPRGTAMRWVIDDTLRRKEVGTKGRLLPNFAGATFELAKAEAARLVVANAATGLFHRHDVQMRWPSPYGRAHGGGVSPRRWEPNITGKLAQIFVTQRRDRTREELRLAIGNVPFSDPEKWTAYVRRAMSLAICDTLLRRRCLCPNDASVATCRAYHGRSFCFTSEEGARILANIWSWRADGAIAKS
jgi:hypothetical protein